eukprot:g2113.t1
MSSEEDEDERTALLDTERKDIMRPSPSLDHGGEVSTLHDAALAEADLERVKRLCGCCGRFRASLLRTIRKLRRKRMTALENPEHEKIMLRRVRQLANSWLDVVPDFEQTIDVDSVEDVLVRARVLPSHNSYEERTIIIKNYGIKAHDGRVYFLDILFLVVIKPFALLLVVER